MKKKKAIKLFARYGGRKGISERILTIAQEIVASGSYKRATAGAGQLQLLAEIADKGDGYWSEMVWRGREKEESFAYSSLDRPPLLTDEGHYATAFFEVDLKRDENKKTKPE